MQVDKVVAQVSKPAVSQSFQPADAAKSNTHCLPERTADLEIGDTAGLETCATARARDTTAADRLCGGPVGPVTKCKAALTSIDIKLHKCRPFPSLLGDAIFATDIRQPPKL